MFKAVFLDRDGVINELIYHHEQEVIDSPFTPGQVKLLPGVPEAIQTLRNAGYLTVLVSNQPGIAKGHMSPSVFEKIKQKVKTELGKAGTGLDGEYYCLHHPDAVSEEYRANCECRKPKPGLLLQAAQELHIDLRHSWFIGDNLSDVQAGNSAGCWTMLLAKPKCELCHKMDEKKARPHAIAPNLPEAARHILGETASAHRETIECILGNENFSEKRLL